MQVLDVILRLAWLQSVVNFHVTFLHRTALTTIVACLEILRRGMWNFFRLENEHLNNVRKIPCIQVSPTPFQLITMMKIVVERMKIVQG
ncbi:hypothetical protein MKW98_023492 [Papaver atlanticum]|uniref:EXS domain-containing protein n=1 Tax=Papaver atlanticum TaxID=357466 RepID=A0AAD4XN42_9MAGN|nr:hypothetical protein MKW98_023492 [Papaver atlanticum]